ncbi:MAG: hypothetical protein COX52_10395 [Syntrophobacterales bacterium CG23_combo_of_CG06-09_8_20_14_all_48_27]|nr:MAG: hypothetical protein COX52_10395 [Syntrophobacterales bacterium CG23_combo_of_CG06-09_8_20_14_all_48_27]
MSIAVLSVVHTIFTLHIEPNAQTTIGYLTADTQENTPTKRFYLESLAKSTSNSSLERMRRKTMKKLTILQILNNWFATKLYNLVLWLNKISKYANRQADKHERYGH